MDLYRYFHPHHNPRLRNEPLRLQELSELEQAASELKKAVKRAEIRCQTKTSKESSTEEELERTRAMGGIKKEHFSQVLVALEYVVESLSTLTEAHPGDDDEVMSKILKERENAPGWENWCCLLEQRLSMTTPGKIAK